MSILFGAMFMNFTWQVMKKAADTIEGCYKIPNLRFRGHVCKTNTPSNTSFRGLGRPQSTVIIEEIISKVARSLNMSPEKVRFYTLFS